MADFNQAVELVLKHEGGFTPGLPDDPGGATNFGISQRAYPDLDIKNLTIEQAKAIYQRDYWTSYMAGCNSQALANCALDCAVNQGPVTAGQLFLVSRDNLKDFQVHRLMRYALSNKSQFYKSWFSRTLDV